MDLNPNDVSPQELAKLANQSPNQERAGGGSTLSSIAKAAIAPLLITSVAVASSAAGMHLLRSGGIIQRAAENLIKSGSTGKLIQGVVEYTSKSTDFHRSFTRLGLSLLEKSEAYQSGNREWLKTLVDQGRKHLARSDLAEISRQAAHEVTKTMQGDYTVAGIRRTLLRRGTSGVSSVKAENDAFLKKVQELAQGGGKELQTLAAQYSSADGHIGASFYRRLAVSKWTKDYASSLIPIYAVSRAFSPHSDSSNQGANPWYRLDKQVLSFAKYVAVDAPIFALMSGAAGVAKAGLVGMQNVARNVLSGSGSKFAEQYIDAVHRTVRSGRAYKTAFDEALKSANVRFEKSQSNFIDRILNTSKHLIQTFKGGATIQGQTFHQVVNKYKQGYDVSAKKAYGGADEFMDYMLNVALDKSDNINKQSSGFLLEVTKATLNSSSQRSVKNAMGRSSGTFRSFMSILGLKTRSNSYSTSEIAESLERSLSRKNLKGVNRDNIRNLFSPEHIEYIAQQSEALIDKHTLVLEGNRNINAKFLDPTYVAKQGISKLSAAIALNIPFMGRISLKSLVTTREETKNIGHVITKNDTFVLPTRGRTTSTVFNTDYLVKPGAGDVQEVLPFYSPGKAKTLLGGGGERFGITGFGQLLHVEARVEPSQTAGMAELMGQKGSDYIVKSVLRRDNEVSREFFLKNYIGPQHGKLLQIVKTFHYNGAVDERKETSYAGVMNEWLTERAKRHGLEGQPQKDIVNSFGPGEYMMYKSKYLFERALNKLEIGKYASSNSSNVFNKYITQPLRRVLDRNEPANLLETDLWKKMGEVSQRSGAMSQQEMQEATKVMLLLQNKLDKVIGKKASFAESDSEVIVKVLKKLGAISDDFDIKDTNHLLSKVSEYEQFANSMSNRTIAQGSPSHVHTGVVKDSSLEEAIRVKNYVSNQGITSEAELSQELRKIKVGQGVEHLGGFVNPREVDAKELLQNVVLQQEFNKVARQGTELIPTGSLSETTDIFQSFRQMILNEAGGAPLEEEALNAMILKSGINQQYGGNIQKYLKEELSTAEAQELEAGVRHTYDFITKGGYSELSAKTLGDYAGVTPEVLISTPGALNISTSFHTTSLGFDKQRLKEVMTRAMKGLTPESQIYENVIPKMSDILTSKQIFQIEATQKLNKVLSYTGLGLDQDAYGTPLSYLTAFTKKRILPAAALVGGVVAADKLVDALPIFDYTALDEGFLTYGAEKIAKLRYRQAQILDATGITSAAQYMEGLMPGSVESPLSRFARTPFALGAAGAAIGKAIGGFTGGAAGVLTGIASSALLGFGLTDLTETPERLADVYAGRQDVAHRKGAFWELCLDGDTKILTENNFVEIKNIKPGDIVRNYKGKYTKVSAVSSHKESKLAKVSALSLLDPVILTRDHPLYVYDEVEDKFVWKPVENINIKTDLLAYYIHNDNDDKYFDLKKYAPDRQFIHDKIPYSYELGFIFGIFLGDGSIDMYSQPRALDVLIGKEDCSLLEKLNNCCGEVFGINGAIWTSPNKKYSHLVRLRIFSVALATLFVRIFGSRKSLLNQDILSSNNKEFNIGLLDGLLSTDGYIRQNDKSEEVTFTNISSNILYLFVNILAKLEIPYSIYRHTYKTKSPQNTAYKVRIPYKPLYNLCNNYKKFNMLHIKIKDKVTPRVTKDFILKSKNNYALLPIRSIEFFEEERVVYDIRVPNGNSFSGFYITFHNSGESYFGEKIDYYGKSWFTKMKFKPRSTPEFEGSELEQMLFKNWPIVDFNPIGALIDPYHYEKKLYEERPAPVSAPYFQNMPIIGSLMGGTLGSILKPPRIMHKSELGELGGEKSETSAGGSLGPENYMGLGGGIGNQEAGLIPGTLEMRHDSPMHPQSLPSILSESYYRMVEEPLGIFGFGLTSMVGEPFANKPQLEQQNLSDFNQAFYELGGAAGLSEPFRRMFPRTRKNIEYVNPLQNTMPHWLPEEYQYGDALGRVPEAEYRLPTRARELVEPIEHTFPVSGSTMGKEISDIVKSMLGIRDPYSEDSEEIMSGGTELHRYIQQELAMKNELLKAEEEIFDPKLNISGSIDAIIKGPDGKGSRIVEIKSIAADKFKTLDKPKWENTGQLISYMGITGRTQDPGYLLYVNREDPSQRKMFTVEFSQNRWEKILQNIEQARQISTEMMEQGVGNVGESYSFADRAILLSNIAPMSDEYKKNRQRAEIQKNMGMLEESTAERLSKADYQREHILRQYDLYPYRFYGRVLSPDATYNLTSVSQHIKDPDSENFMNSDEFIKPADQYSLFERCFAGDTLIQTDKGMVEIKDIKIGDLVLTHKGRFKKVIKLSKRKKDPDEKVYKVSIQGIPPIIVSEEHPFFGVEASKCSYWSNNKTVCIKRYNSKNCTKCSKKLYPNYNPKWIRVNEFTENTFVLSPIISYPDEHILDIANILSNYPRIEISDNIKFVNSNNRQTPLPKTIYKSPELYEIFGWFIAEGSYNSAKYPYYGLNFVLNIKEDTYINKLKSNFKTIFNIESKISKSEETHTIILKVYSGLISILFKNLFGTGAQKKYLNKNVLSTNNLNMSVLIDNYNLGDGWIENNDIYYIKSVSPSLIFTSGNLLNLLDHIPNIRKEKGKSSYICNNRKITEGKDSYVLSWRKNRKFLVNVYMDNRYVYHRIVSKKSIEFNDFLYNIEVEDDHSYTANSIAVHNSIGAAWEAVSHANVPIVHEKFLNYESPIEKYEREMYRSGGMWNQPYESFASKWIQSSLSKQSALEGGMSWGLGGLLLGGPVGGAVGGALGATYGSVNGLLGKVTGNETYISSEVEKKWEAEEYLDYLQNARQGQLYALTGDEKYADSAKSTFAYFNGRSPQTPQEWSYLYKAVPKDLKPFYNIFSRIQDANEQNKIRSMIPEFTKGQLETMWGSGKKLGSALATNASVISENTVDYFNKRSLPNQDESFWNPNANYEDIEASILKDDGMNLHDFGMGWYKQQQRMRNSPYLDDISIDMGESASKDNPVLLTSGSNPSTTLLSGLKSLGIPPSCVSISGDLSSGSITVKIQV